MSQFRTIDNIFQQPAPVICSDPVITREQIAAGLAPVITLVLCIMLGLSVFICVTLNASFPVSQESYLGDLPDIRANYDRAYSISNYSKVLNGNPTDLNYALWLSCVKYHSQPACDQINKIDQNAAKQLELRKQ